MAKTKEKHDNQGLDLIENPDAVLTRAEAFFGEKKNQTLVSVVGGLLALVIAGYMGYTYYMDNRNQEAQEEMFQAVYYFESDSLGRALNGDGNNYGFLDIMDLYSGTEAANLSSFYTGSIYMKLSEWESAIRYLDRLESSDMLVQARAYSLIADAYIEMDDFENAVKYYQQAINHKPNKQFTPVYLTKLAVAYETMGQLEQAAVTYGTIVKEYFGSTEYPEAQKHKARLEGLIAE